MSRGLRPRLRRRTLVVPAALLALVATAPASSRTMGEALEDRGIRDARVLDAFDRVSREAFAAPEGAELLTLARLADALDVGPDARVLTVGGASGYPAALLAEIAGSVFAVVSDDEVARAARVRLTEAGYRNVHVKRGDAAEGWRAYGPYDAVLVASPAPGVHQALIEQLREDGVLVIAVRDAGGKQTLLRGVKKGFKLRARAVASALPTHEAPVSARGTERRPAPETDGRDPQGARTRDVREPGAPDSDRPTEDE